jgi:cytochrome b
VSSTTPAASSGRVLVWSVPIRVLHWSLAAVVAFDLVRDDGGWLHRTVGYVAVAIVVLRLLWSALGGGHDRLAALKPSPAGTLAYLRAAGRGRAPRQRGHDPLGLWMVWLLWSLVALLGLTGWMSGLDMFWGDERVHDVHAVLAEILQVAVIAHLAGVAVMSWHWRENLPAAMVTGRKREIDPAD